MADAADSPDVTKPAWESEVMTYVAYGAAQVDAIGKIAPKLSIDFLYKEPTHSQHGLTVEHGMDFMSVGNTVGAHAPFVREPDGTIVRPWSTDAYLQEASDRVVVASRNVLERTLLVPWMGCAIVATDALSARPIRAENRTQAALRAAQLGPSTLNGELHGADERDAVWG